MCVSETPAIQLSLYNAMQSRCAARMALSAAGAKILVQSADRRSENVKNEVWGPQARTFLALEHFKHAQKIVIILTKILAF